ncbi:MAG: sigma-70 family RNA polymerase sigma factor [Planctomycetes bacterium]|nr:sigma-70 family RNA polymerase sigma factor [Planctomycetota bacterium]
MKKEPMPALAADAPKTGTALGERLSALSEPLFAFACARCGQREAALDAVQEALVAAIAASRRGQDWPDDEALWAWMIAVTRNKLVDEHRRGRIPSLSKVGLTPESVEQTLFAGRTPPPDAAGREELGRFCRAAISELPPRQQRALEATYREGMDYDTVGAELGMSAAGAKSLVVRAREALLAALRRKMANPEDLI